MSQRAKRLCQYLENDLGWDCYDKRQDCKCGASSYDKKFCGNCGAKLPRFRPKAEQLAGVEKAIKYALKEKP